MIRIALCVALLCLGSWSAAAQTSLSGDEAWLFQTLNQERARLGLLGFTLDDSLIVAARNHSTQMAAQSLLSHQLANEPDPSARFATAGALFDASAENVAFAGTIQQAHDGLMRSPPHFANIKDPHYNRVGIGVVRRGDRLYVTEDFAHALPAFSDEQFRAALVTSLNRARQSHGLKELLVNPSPSLHQAACAQRSDLKALHNTVPDATKFSAFTIASPDALPKDLDRVAGDPALHWINLGVCRRLGNFATFSVVAAFYP